MSSPQQPTLLTPAEYLQIERAAEYQSEYYCGKSSAMSYGPAPHALIRANVMGILRFRLKGQRCCAYGGDLRIKCPTGLYTYSDGSVFCSKLECEDGNHDTVLNPTLLIEVLSKSTEAYDRGKKFTHYRTIQSLREYVLVSQDEPMVQSFLRNDDGTWTLNAVCNIDQSIMLRSIGVELPLAEVYERVDFTAESEEGKKLV